MGYPHFSGDCIDHHDRVVDWGRIPREDVRCPVSPGGHHSYKLEWTDDDGVEHWVCTAPKTASVSGICNTQFVRGPDQTFYPAGVVTLCGSSRFFSAYQEQYYQLTMEGWIVLSIGFYPHASEEHGHGEGVGHDSEQKLILDQLHLRKIDMSDRVHVINLEGYIGQSTQNEIDYGIMRGRTVTYMEEPQ